MKKGKGNLADELKRLREAVEKVGAKASSAEPERGLLEQLKRKGGSRGLA